MSTGNRLMIVCMTLVAMSCIVACVILALHGQATALAIFVGIGTSALSSLQPSALHQTPPAAPPAVAADNVEAVNVSTSGETAP